MDNILTFLAVISPVCVVILIYYRAHLKRAIEYDGYDEPNEKNFTFPGPNSFYNTFIRDPVMKNDSPNIRSLLRRYKIVSGFIKYVVIFSLLFNIVRAVLINMRYTQ